MVKDKDIYTLVEKKKLMEKLKIIIQFIKLKI